MQTLRASLQRRNEETNKPISDQCPHRARAPSRGPRTQEQYMQLQLRIAVRFIVYRRADSMRFGGYGRHCIVGVIDFVEKVDAFECGCGWCGYR